MEAQLGDVAVVNGRLAQVIAINVGNREITFEFDGSKACPTCGRPDRVSINEATPLWRQSVRPVQTCGESVPPDTDPGPSLGELAKGLGW